MTTKPEINPSLTQEEKRVCIAEALGLEVLPAAGRSRAMCREKVKSGRPSDDWFSLPNYFESLDACHEMEKALSEDQLADYTIALYNLCKGGDVMAYRATAAQRATAFGIALNLWNE